MTKLQALAKFLDCDHEGIEDIESIRENVFQCHQAKYLVLTDKEAAELTAAYIKQTLWAFNIEFMRSHMECFDNLNSHESIELCKSFRKMQEEQCENCNVVFKNLVGNRITYLIADAIISDGRGHFLSQYDGEEYEEGEYFIYRIN